MKRRVFNFVAAALLLAEIGCANSPKHPRSINSEPESGFVFERPFTMMGEPVRPEADQQRELRFKEWADRNFVTTVDLFLDSDDLRRGTPTIAGVVLRHAYEVGELPYLAFQSTLRRDRWFWLQVPSIVALRFSLDPAKLPDPAHGHMTSPQRLVNMRQLEMNALTDREQAESQLPLFNVRDLLVHQGELYFSGAGLRDHAGLRVGPACAQGSVGGCLFIRFFDAWDEKGRWLINMNEVVAIRPRNKKR